jgi:8-oxo-dGTP pyrophosphatase MutT (NUDIX family)
MPVEKSAGAIIFTQHHLQEKSQKQKKETKNGAGFRKKETKIYYLLLHYPSSAKAKKEYWDLPKGHIEKGEKELDTVKREVEEETGLKDIRVINGFKEWIKYFFRVKDKTIFKIVTFYLAEAKTRHVKISEEHIGYQWLPYKEALAKLTFKNAKGVLMKAHYFLEKHAAAS